VTRSLVFAFAALLCQGCFLAPGMRMDEGALKDRGRGTSDPSRYRVLRITPQLLVAQAQARAKAEAKGPEVPAAAVPLAEYRISPHDVLSIIVWEHPELTIPAGEFRSAETSGYIVSAEGTIFFPHVGLVQVAGRTREEVRLDLTERLSSYVRDPQLQILVAAYRGKRAQIAGEVIQPSAVPITDVPLRVQDAIALAKGLTPEADPAHVTLTRGGEVHVLDLLALYERGDTAQNWVLQDGDVVHVPDRNRNKVFVLGEVKKPASKVMPRGRMTLADALGDAEGLDLVYANPGEIYVFRGQYEAPEIYLLDASSPDALLLATHFQLEPHDVVFVSTYNLGRFSRVINQILPTVQGIWQTYDIVRRR
jgi:polysaccharide export outer membrane protein